jgi:parvulin-like peptidyl-prolyl isomerase
MKLESNGGMRRCRTIGVMALVALVALPAFAQSTGGSRRNTSPTPSAVAASTTTATVPATLAVPGDTVYAYVGDAPVMVSEVVSRINALPPDDFRRLASQSNGLRDFIDQYLTVRLVVEQTQGLGIESTETYARRMKLAADQTLFDLYLRRLMEGVPPPTEAEMDVHYRLNLAAYSRPAMVTLKYVLLRPEQAELAAQIQREAVQGTDFDLLVRRFSIISDSVTTLAAPAIEAEIREAMVLLPVGGVFPPFTTAQGIYVFKKIAGEPARILSYAEVKESVRQALHREKVQSFVATYLETIKRDHPIRVVGNIISE